MARDDEGRNLATLVGVAQQLGATFELIPLLHTIERAGCTALNCDRATIFLYDATSEELYSVVATGTGEIRFPVTRGIAGEAARTRAVIHVPDAYADQRFNQDVDRRTGYRTRNLLTLPLVTPAGELMGVLQVLNKLDGDFTDGDLLLAGALGALTGTAIKRQLLLDEAAVKRRLERDLDIAREIQQQMLPKSDPQVHGYDIAGWNKPADQTGGDAYSFLTMPEGLGFTIADATGHGIGPALMVAQYRAMLRALAPALQDVRGTAVRINELLCDDLPDGKFVTACFGVLSPAEAELKYISAGHGPILLYHAATGEFEELATTGLPLGVMEDGGLQEATRIRLQPGDVFVLLTDGFFEWSGPDGKQYGQTRVCELLHRKRDLPCARLIQALYQDVLQFAAGTAQQDDLTAILIKRNT